MPTDADKPNDLMPHRQPPKPGRSHRWRRIGYTYLALLVASFITQVFTDRPDPIPHAYETVTLPTQTRDGPVTDADERGRVVAATVEMAYRAYGDDDNPAVLLLHGSPGDSRIFEGLGPMLAEAGYRVIVPDLPGFGYSDRWLPDYSNRAHARYVNDLMDTLDIDSAHLVGFSMSGGVVLNLYDLYPDRVQTLILFAAIGIQEGEGSGDYYFEHLKYGLGYAALVGGFEFVPHFGAIDYLPSEMLEPFGKRSNRHAFLRNFWDTDQRPNRAILERYDKPMLILHGEADPMVPAWTAYEHHKIVEHSELVMRSAEDFEGDALIVNHAMVFTDRGNGYVADALLPFLAKHREPGVVPVRLTTDHTAGQAQAPSLRLPGDLEVRRSMSPWLKIGVIITATLILEDPASIAVGLFIKAGQLDPFLGVFAVLVGIFVGDLLLYLIGYIVGRRALRWKPIARWVPTRQVDALGAWFDQAGWKAVLASRFIPGTRLPLYVAAGVTGNKPGRFMLWTFLAVCIWVPVILGMVLLLGEAARSPFQVLLDRGGWLAFAGLVVGLMFLLHTGIMLVTREGRLRLRVKAIRQVRYEYWPGWKFYLPLMPYFAWLCLKYRSLTVWTLADPCMPDGGVVGESKSDILSKIDDPDVLRHALIPDAGGPSSRAEHATRIMSERGWTYPLILKPDAAQRGAGVKLIERDDDLAQWFTECDGPAQLQQYHPGPCECGIFYTRMPGYEHGSIFSITDKVFPILVGDGKSNLEELIWNHPRFRLQHDVFHLRWADELDRVLAKGEELRLAEAGNHCQGTLFQDGARLITPQLAARIDALVKRLDGFYFGRIDVRYTDEASLKRGEGLAIIEINGVTSESTNLYDPTWSLWKAHAVLRQQWAICFAIGDAIRKRDGIKPKSGIRLLIDVIRYYRVRHVATVSD